MSHSRNPSVSSNIMIPPPNEITRPSTSNQTTTVSPIQMFPTHALINPRPISQQQPTQQLQQQPQPPVISPRLQQTNLSSPRFHVKILNDPNNVSTNPVMNALSNITQHITSVSHIPSNPTYNSGTCPNSPSFIQHSPNDAKLPLKSPGLVNVEPSSPKLLINSTNYNLPPGTPPPLPPRLRRRESSASEISSPQQVSSYFYVKCR